MALKYKGSSYCWRIMRSHMTSVSLAVFLKNSTGPECAWHSRNKEEEGCNQDNLFLSLNDQQHIDCKPWCAKPAFACASALPFEVYYCFPQYNTKQDSSTFTLEFHWNHRSNILFMFLTVFAAKGKQWIPRYKQRWLTKNGVWQEQTGQSKQSIDGAGGCIRECVSNQPLCGEMQDPCRYWR